MDEQRLYQLAFKIVRLETVASSIEKLTDAQRRALSKSAIQLVKKLYTYLDFLEEKSLKKREGKMAAAKRLTTESPTIIELASAQKVKIDDAYLVDDDKYNNNLLLISLGLTSLEAIHIVERRVFWYDFDDNLLVRILTTREKRFVNSWIKGQLKKQGFQRLIGFSIIHKLFRANACSKLPVEQYIQLFVDGARLDVKETLINRVIPLANYLKQNPDVLNKEFWHIFKIDTRAFAHDYYEGKRWDEYQSWRSAILELYEQGYISRGKLLSSLLEAIRVNSNSRAIDNMMKFYNSLEPNAKEIAKNKQKVLALLSHEVDAGVRVGVSFTQTLFRHKQLKLDELLQKVKPVFNLGAKTQPLIILKIIETTLDDKFSDAQVDNTSRIMILLAAVIHAQQDVQDKALELIVQIFNNTEISDQQKQSIVQELDKVSAIVSAKNRKQIRKLISTLGNHHQQNQVDQSNETASQSINWKIVNQAIKEMPLEQKVSCGLDVIDEPINSQNYDDMLKKVVRSKSVIEYRLPCSEQIAELKNADEVFLLIAKLIETCESALDIEYMLNGISQYCGQQIENIELKSKPLLKRADKVILNWRETSLLGEDLMGTLLYKLIVTWLGGEIEQEIPEFDEILYETWSYEQREIEYVKEGYIYKQVTTYKDDIPHIETTKMRKYREPKNREQVQEVAHSFTKGRLLEILQRIKQGVYIPLLSTPTHQMGWIDSTLLAERVQTYEKKCFEIGSYDFLQSLLRVNPTINHHKAIEKLKTCSSPYAQILRFALGDKVKPNIDNRRYLVFWLTAARIRKLDGSSEKYFSDVKGIKSVCYSILNPAEIKFQFTMNIYASYATSDMSVVDKKLKKVIIGGLVADHSFVPLEFQALKPALKTTQTPKCVETDEDYIGLLPILINYDGNQDNGLGTGAWGIRWHLMIWPSNLAYFYIGGFRHLCFGMGENASNSIPNFAYLEPLFHKEISLTRPAMLTLVIALNSRDQDVFRLGIDLLIELIEDARICSAMLTDYIKELSTTEVIKANRVGAALQEVANISLLHNIVVGEVLQNYFIVIEKYPRNSHLLLQVLQDYFITLQKKPSPALLVRMKAIKGTTKVALLAKDVVKLAEIDEKDSGNEIVAKTLIQNRIDIALAKNSSYLV